MGLRHDVEQDLAILNTVFQHAPVGVAFIDQQFRYRRVNTILADAHALPVEQHIGKTVAEVVPDLWPTLEPLYRRALSGETILNIETIAPRRSSAPSGHHWLVSYYPVSLDGAIIGVDVIANDITERRGAEGKLRRSEASLANAQRIAKIGHFDRDLRTGGAYWSDQIYEIFGLSKADGDITYERFLERVHPEDRAGREAYEGATVGGAQEQRYRIVLPDGTVKTVHSIGQIERDAEGRPARVSGTLQDVTERTRAEAVVGRIAAIVESSDDAILAQDLNGIITSWNRAAERMFGYTADEMIGNPVLRLIPEHRHGEEQRIIRTIAAGGHVDQFETVRQAKDGRNIELSIAVSPIQDAAGQVIGVSKTARDITERNEAEGERRASEARYRALFDYAPDGIVITDPNGIYLDVNPGLCRLLGYTREELIGRATSSVVVPSEIEHIEPALTAIKSSPAYQREWLFQRRDGSTIAADVIATTMPDGNLLALIRDVTERNRAAEILEQSGREVRGIAGQLAIERAHLVAAQAVAKMGSWTTDLQTLDVTWSAETHRIFETNPSTFVPNHQDFLRLVHPEDRLAVDGAFGRSLDTQAPTSVEHRIGLPDGRVKFVRESWQIERDASGAPTRAVGTTLDITERRAAEQALRDSEGRLRESMAELQAVSARLNEAREQERVKMALDIHDHLGQALTALKMDIKDLRRRLDAGDTAVMRERIEEMSTLIDTSVNDVRRVAAELRPVILDDLGFVAAMRGYLIDVERRSGIRCVLATGLTDLMIADDRATALFRILQEALTNVVRHAEATRVDVSLTLDAGWVRLVIRDNGRGLPPEGARNPRSLGLVGMRDRARLFGGDVNVAGEPGKGTTISVDLAVTEGAP